MNEPEFIYEYSDPEIDVESGSNDYGKYLRAGISLMLLIVFAFSVFQFAIDRTAVRIVSVRDHLTDQQIEQVDISTLSRSTTNSSGEVDTYPGAKLPFKIPVDGGECTVVDIRAEGYHPWDELICPKTNQQLDIQLELVPLEMTPPQSDKQQT